MLISVVEGHEEEMRRLEASKRDGCKVPRTAKAQLNRPYSSNRARQQQVAYLNEANHLSAQSTRRKHHTPCHSSAHLASSALRAASSKSSRASPPRPHHSNTARSLPRPRARAATHTVTLTTRRPDGSLALSRARRLRRRAGRMSSTTASLAPWLLALLATGSNQILGML
jgi:hypothetical protein